MSDRLAERRGELIDRGRTVTFSWQGEQVEGLAGDTIASALYARGVRIFSRSFKYHRKRGLLCCSGQCPNCLVQVDGDPAVRACTTPIAAGMQVEHINAWPSLERDALHALAKATPAFGMQVGFYYKTFMRPRWAWKYYERFLRSAAGLGKLDPEHRRDRRYEKVHRHVDVLVIGGGESGLQAAIAAAGEGRDTALVDEGLALGGRLAFSGIAAAARAAELESAARAAGVEILQPAWAGGVYEGNLVPVYQGDTMFRFRAGEIVLATGVIEQPLVFGGNDLPGVMLGSGVRRLVNQYRIAPGERGGRADGRRPRHRDAPATWPRPACTSRRSSTPARASPTSGSACAGSSTCAASAPVEARGSDHVTAVVVARGSERRTLAADLVAMSGGTVAQFGALVQAGGSVRYDAAPQRVRARPRPRGRARRRRARGHRGGRARCGGRGQGQAVRLLLRGRHDEGRAPLRRGGVPLARALQALHDRDDGPVPGQDVPPQLRPSDGAGARASTPTSSGWA